VHVATIVGALVDRLRIDDPVFVGLRISEEEEYHGADMAECGLEAYPEFTN